MTGNENEHVRLVPNVNALRLNSMKNIWGVINYEDVDVYEKVLMATRRQIGAGKALKDEDPMYSV